MNSPAAASLLALARHSPQIRTAQLSLDLGEAVPIEAMHETWQRIASNHEALASHEVKWSELDWSAGPAADLPARWSALVADEASKHPGSPTIIAIRLPGAGVHLLITYPRALFDEESWFFILCEWVEILEGRQIEQLTADKEMPPPDPSWWREMLTPPATGEIRAFPEGAEEDVAEESLLLDRQTSQSLRSAATACHASEEAVFFAIWNIVLSRLALCLDPLHLVSLEIPGAPSVGSRINPLPLRLATAPTSTLAAMVEGAARLLDIARLKAHAPLSDPGNDGVDFSAPSATLSHFAFLPPPLNDRIPDAYPRWINLDCRLLDSPLHPVSLEVRDGARLGLRIAVRGRQAPLTPSLMQWFRGVLTAFLESPETTLCEIAFGAGESIQHPDTTRPMEPPPIHDIILDVAQRAGDSIAAVDRADNSITYSQLADRSSSIASHLASLNLTGGWVMGVCLTPGIWVPSAMLAILRTGNTLLVLNPEQSSAEILRQVESADCGFILCDESTYPLFEQGSGPQVLVVDSEDSRWPEDPPPTDVEDPDIAAVCLPGPGYPAPLISQLSPPLLSHAVKRSARIYRLEPDSRFLVSARPGSMAYLEETLCPLTVGATAYYTGMEEGIPDPVTHCRMSADEFRDHALSDSPAIPPSLLVIAVDTQDSFIPSKLLAAWSQHAPPRLRWIQFLSPIGFAGIGLRWIAGENRFDPGAAAVPAGKASKSCGAEIVDLMGHIPPSGVAGLLRFSPDFGPEEPVEAGLAYLDPYGEVRLLGDWERVAAATLVPGIRDARASASDPGRVDLIFEEGVDRDAIAKKVGELTGLRHLTPGEPATPPASTPLTPADTDGNPSQVLLFDEKDVSALPEDATGKPAIEHWGGSNDLPVLYLLVSDSDFDAARTSLTPTLSTEWNVFGLNADLTTDWEPHLTQQEALHFVGIGRAGLITYELVRSLRKAGRDVPYAVVAGSDPPTPAPTGWWSRLMNSLGGGSDRFEGPLGIILTSECPDDATTRWSSLIPLCIIEQVDCPRDQLVRDSANHLLRLLAQFAE